MNKFSRDPKIEVVSLTEFLQSSDYLANIQDSIWNGKEKPCHEKYYKITPKFLILLNFYGTSLYFGSVPTWILKSIQVACRDGATEYQLIDDKINELEEKLNLEYNKTLDEMIENIEKGRSILRNIKYCDKEGVEKEQKSFKDYIVDIEYKTTIELLKSKYVVFDVETNGTRTANDDLLSISIYDPTIGKCYNRFLPLDLQPLVLTQWKNGITDEDIERATHITQEELDNVINFFDLRNKTLLSFSGGKGKFDPDFLINYCKRHNLVGVEKLSFSNIKSMLPTVDEYAAGQLSKDNLCRVLQIDGVQEKHSSMNDCILEWKLFEKIKSEQLFIIKQAIYKFHEGYIVPVSYLGSCPELVKYAGITIPNILGRPKCLFEFSLPEKVASQIIKFSNNITGIAVENGVNCVLNVEKQDNDAFLRKNKQQLDYIASLETARNELVIETQEDGTIKSVDSTNVELIDHINEVTKILISALTPVFDFVKKEIFPTGTIMSQELSISEDGKILALCDLSNQYSVMEIKTFSVVECDGLISDQLARQLYYESNGRKPYILSIDIINSPKSKVNVRIYGIDLENIEHPIERFITLNDYQQNVLKLIKKKQEITKNEIAKKLKITTYGVGTIIGSLKRYKYILKENESYKRSKWIILRNPNNYKTKYLYDHGRYTLIIDDFLSSDTVG